MRDMFRDLNSMCKEWEEGSDEAKTLHWAIEEINKLNKQKIELTEDLFRKERVINSALCKIEENFKGEARHIHGTLLEGMRRHRD